MTDILDKDEVDDLKKVACATIDKAYGELHNLSQSIWQNPELNYAEHHAHDLLTSYLLKQDFQVEKSLHLETAFRATAGLSSKPNVAVMCEYDALPDIGHACGHNLIAVLGIAAGLGIKAALQSSERKLGQVTVLGCPAEESGGGKVDLIRQGVFCDIDAALMAHPTKYTAPTMRIFATTDLHVTFKGKASHAAAAPWSGINALDSAVLAYNNISAMRQQMKSDWLIHGIIKEGGRRPNIIPEKTVLEYFLRTARYNDLSVLKEKVIACFDGAARATGCEVFYEWANNPYRDMVYNDILLSHYKQASRELKIAGDGKEEIYSTFIGGSTDMGNVSHVVPSIHPFYSITDSAIIHTREFQAAAGTERAFAQTLEQAKALAMTAIDLYSSPATLHQMKLEFNQSPYVATEISKSSL